jgi:SpoVK/Ycf46/Vps4 family AAA+-type ATPase
MYVDGDDKGIIYYDPKDEKDKDSLFYTLLGLLKPYKKPKVTKNKIYIVYNTPHGFDKIGFDVKKIDVDINENYNNNFLEMSEQIIEGLNSRNKTNLVILSGDPGTGKTTYIRYLTSHLKKNIIFIPPDMVDSITDPGFIPFLMKNNDSILIIEDAEPALEKRGSGGRSSAVSNVLNLTDGLLSDCLKISIVATFNTGTKNIDEALTRKGRLLMNYKFEKLCIEKSIKLLEKLGHKDVKVIKPMTLADIYYYGIDNNTKEMEIKKTGFRQNE